MTDIVLVHSPLVGPSSLQPTADVLKGTGVRCHVPSPARIGDDIPAWRHWPRLLREQLPDLDSPVVVGHSAGGLLAAHLAATLKARALVCLDAMMPPESGSTPPVESSFLTFVRSLPVVEGRVPVWTRWWGGDLLAAAPLDAAFKAAFAAELPALRLDWFDDAFEMPDWSASRKAFIRTSKVFDDEADRAVARGWPVSRLDGTHLHPTLKPEETAAEILRVVRPA